MPSAPNPLDWLIDVPYVRREFDASPQAYEINNKQHRQGNARKNSEKEKNVEEKHHSNPIYGLNMNQHRARRSGKSIVVLITFPSCRGVKRDGKKNQL